MSTLVSGASGGLGRYLSYKLSSDVYQRSKENSLLKNKFYNKIIHCAFGRQFQGQSEYEYIDYQINIAKELLKFNHRKFIFLSSIDMTSQELSSYGKAKMEVEKLIMKNTKDFLIIRPGLLFGKGMRMNSILKVALEKNATLTLTPSSTFYPIFYTDIEELINLQMTGIFHLITEKHISLKEVSNEYHTNPNWGEYTYKSPDLNFKYNKFISKDMSLYKPLERIKKFINDNGWKLN